jgi:hypothetical protein
MAVLATAQRRTNAPTYDPAKEITIQGTVEDVISAQRGAMTGVHLKVKTEAETFDVRLGPAWFLDRKKFKFAKGDEISVTGATLTTTAEAGQIVIAREVKKGDAVLTLRDAKGFPQWSRRQNRT